MEAEEELQEQWPNCGVREEMVVVEHELVNLEITHDYVTRDLTTHNYVTRDLTTHNYVTRDLTTHNYVTKG